MAVLTVTEITRVGVEDTLTAAAGGGDSFPNDGRTYLEVFNGGGSSINVTVVTQKTVDGKAVADDVIAVDASGRKKLGPWPPDIYNDVNGRVQITYSAVTSVTVNPFRLP